jgi:hypothetical protein
MSGSEDQPGSDEQDLGEDHREGQPGYDLDEQEAIEELQRDEDDGSAE